MFIKSTPFSFNGRDGEITKFQNHSVIRWNGGTLSIALDGSIISFSRGIPRKIHAQIRQAAGV